MPTISELHNRPVVSMSEGHRLGTVRDALVDPATKSVGGFLVAGEDGEFALPLARVTAIGPDAVTVESVSGTQGAVAPGGLEGLRRFHDLTKIPVVDEGGKHLGHLGDATFDPQTGGISQVQFRTGGFLGFAEQRSEQPISVVRAFGQNVVTVESVPTP